MLRGAQTPGELKQRADRLHAFADLAAVDAALDRLIGRDLAARVQRRPGQKEERYVHRLGEEAAEESPAAVPRAATAAPAPTADHSPLEDQVAALRREVIQRLQERLP